MLKTKLIIFIFLVKISIICFNYVLGFQYAYFLYNHHLQSYIARISDVLLSISLVSFSFPVRDTAEIKAFRNNEVKGCGTFPHFPFSFPGGNSPGGQRQCRGETEKNKAGGRKEVDEQARPFDPNHPLIFPRCANRQWPRSALNTG